MATDQQARGGGVITLLPSSKAVFSDPVEATGGVVGELSDDTRAIVWLSAGRGEELATVLRAHPAIRWVQLPFAGVDAFLPVLAEFPQLLWTSAKGAYARPVAEHALMLMLALLRRVPMLARAQSWIAQPGGGSLYGASVLAVGAGGIVRELARLLEPFGVHLTVVRRSEEPCEWADRTVTVDHLDQELPSADIVVLAAALGPETHHLISRDELALMKETALLVNIGRGGLVDTEALLAALETGQIAGAGLDVTDPEPLPDGHPLWSDSRVLITPHSAGVPALTAPLLAERLSVNVRAFLSTGDDGAGFVGVVDPVLGY